MRINGEVHPQKYYTVYQKHPPKIFINKSFFVWNCWFDISHLSVFFSSVFFSLCLSIFWCVSLFFPEGKTVANPRDNCHPFLPVWPIILNTTEAKSAGPDRCLTRDNYHPFLSVWPIILNTTEAKGLECRPWSPWSMSYPAYCIWRGGGYDWTCSCRGCSALSYGQL